ncbi:MAG: ECF transporter S component [Oscillospiraceae bacterium]|nr:ECF transporter S component [Oscillospiraceae bacterium]
MNRNVRLLCRTALLLALCIASQFLKNLSVYITGSIVNTILILATLSCGLWSGAAISVIAPLTSWWITGSPIMSAMPVIVPCIMAGNLILVLAVWLFARRPGRRLPLRLGCGMIAGSVAKFVFMWGMICQVILPLLGPGSGLKAPALAAAAANFSLPQLLTALIGSALAFAVWLPLEKYLKKPGV